MSDVSSSRSLHRLIYSSRQRFAPGMIPDEEIDGLIRASIRNNRADAITGLLLVHRGWFVQALEGPAAAVMSTYRRIVNDPRHEQPHIVTAGPAETREFADWNMCARRFSKADDAILDTLEQRAVFNPPSLSAASALRLLKAVRGIQGRTERAALI